MPNSGSVDTAKLNTLEARVAELERNSLSRYSSTFDKKIMEDAVSDVILDIVWNKYYHYHTFFEAAGPTDGTNGWVISSSGVSGVDATGLFIETGNVSGDESFVVKSPGYQNILSFDLESRFRTVIYISDDTAGTGSVDNTQAFIGAGNGVLAGSPTVDQNYYGWYLENNVMYGVTCNATAATQKIVIPDVKFNNLYVLEARYYPGYKAVFSVSDPVAFPSVFSITPAERPKEKATVTATLPSGVGDLTRYQIVTNTSEVRQMGIGFYEYLQQKLTL